MSSSLMVVVLVCVSVTLGVHGTEIHFPGGKLLSSLGVEIGGTRQGSVCLPSTHFITLTSTRVLPSTLYGTSILNIPTTIIQDVTQWQVKSSTVLVTQTVTSYPTPHLITTTQVFYWFPPALSGHNGFSSLMFMNSLNSAPYISYWFYKKLTGTRYVTQMQFQTETKYITKTESKTYTDTAVVTDYATRTRPVTSLYTVTATLTSTHLQRDTFVVTATKYQYVTQTERVPYYLTRTVTSQYVVYETYTHTSVEDEFVTQTSFAFQSSFVTRCSLRTTPTTHYQG
ncbi:hypothetical protein Hamer_G013535 [Homarus americanus]|uniref:Uncharacterized protein n=1 Tax=Homarus americanus TaxID=6706 RepID=A0A8J5KNP3_HOMAM|nr:hypothetical protein Hamer_G013535 [Homarus americanus]